MLESPPAGPALEAGRTADRHVVAQGMIITYEVTVQNVGLAGAADTSLVDSIPTGAS